VTDLPASGDVLGTPAPVLSLGRVTALVRETWGLQAGTVRPLTSERDVNVLVDGRYVLKVSNPAEDPAVVDMENTAMAHAARALTDGSSRITGLIDFGDMHHTAHVCDLAVALTSVLRNTAGPQPAGTWELAGAVLTGYQRHRPLTPPEADVLGDLVLGRLALTLAISRRRAAAYADNQAYISQYDISTRRVLEEFLDLGPDQVTRRLHTMAGTRLAISTGARQSDAESAGLLRRRRLVTGGPLSPLFYSRPLHIVRGEGPWLFAADGTRYLDGTTTSPSSGTPTPPWPRR
jgi:Ser/Thr protein kinase RdoA (MazF antagonist)